MLNDRVLPFFAEQGMGVIRMENNHFRMLRRFAAELLESHELIEAVNN